MKKFIFQLEGLLRHRKNAELQRQRELGIVQAQMRLLQTELQVVDNEVKQALMDLRQHHLVGVIDMNFLTAHRRFMLGMQRKATTLVQRMQLHQRHVDEAQANLSHAATQRKVVEKLKERHYERWKADVNAKENAELDEISLQLTYMDRESMQPDA